MIERSAVLVDMEGSEYLSVVLTDLLNEYPGLKDREIAFSKLDEKNGIAFYPSSGSVLQKNVESITGHVDQTCAYPFTIVYRAAPKTPAQRMQIKEFLDSIGKWLECQQTDADGETYKLDRYPELTLGTRKIKEIRRSSSSHQSAAYQDGVEDWVISMVLIYENEFDK